MLPLSPIDELCTLSLSPQKVAQKENLSFFVNKESIKMLL